MSKSKYFNTLMNEWDSIVKKKNYSSIRPCPACEGTKFNKIFTKKK